MNSGPTICRVYPVFVAGKRIEVRVHGLMALTPATQKAIFELVGAVEKLKRLDVACEVLDPDREKHCDGGSA